MKIIICGAGEVGFSLAKYLSSEKMQVTVIDEDTEKLHKMTSAIDVRSIVGKTYNPKILDEAAVKDADLLIAVSENDESNILVCEMAKILFNVPNTIARIKEKELLKEKWLDLFSDKGFKIDNIISPEIEIAFNFLSTATFVSKFSIVNLKSIDRRAEKCSFSRETDFS